MPRLSKLLILSLGIAGAAPGAGVLEVFQENCVRCHGKDGKVKGKVNLTELGDPGALKKKPELLQEIIDAIDFEEMPPEDEPQLEKGARAKLLGDLQTLRNEAMTGKRVYAATPIRRMNRFQYHNAVIDLFDLKCNVFTLPERMIRDHKGYFRPETGQMPDLVRVGSRPLGKSQMIEPRLGGVAAFPQAWRADHGVGNRAAHTCRSPVSREP